MQTTPDLDLLTLDELLEEIKKRVESFVFVYEIDGKLPNTVSQFGSTPEEIFVSYEDVKNIVGAKDMKKIPLGAIGIYSYSDKIKVGLQQLMAGARCFSIPTITRRELFSLTDECAKVTGIPYIMEAYRDEALKILAS